MPQDAPQNTPPPDKLHSPHIPRTKIFAGARLRRLRQQLGLTQARLAEDLGLSVSYVNMIERNQRPLTAAVLLRLTQVHNVDLRLLTNEEDEALFQNVRAALSDPLFADMTASRAELDDFLAQTPTLAQAFLRIYGTWRDQAMASPGTRPEPRSRDPLEIVRGVIHELRNHFAGIDARAESIADEMRLMAADLFSATCDRLRTRHDVTVRVFPSEVMTLTLRSFDHHARRLHISELLDPASRTFAVAYQLGLLEARAEIEDVVTRAGLKDPVATRLLVQNLASYFAAAVMMPYQRFHMAAESSGYDLELLQARFGAGLEQVAHRLTTLQRPGRRGVPFFLVRTDRAGQISKRFAAGRAPFARVGGSCPLWILHEALDRPGDIHVQVIETEDGLRWFTMARAVHPHGAPYGVPRPNYAIALGCDLSHARALVYARGIDLDAPPTTPVGLACHMCERADCRQRSAPPIGRPLIVDERSRGGTPFRFSLD